MTPRCGQRSRCPHSCWKGSDWQYGMKEEFVISANMMCALLLLRNMFTCRHDGVETLNFFLRWLELDTCGWLRCSECSEICTRDHNLGGIDRVKKAKGITHVVIVRFPRLAGTALVTTLLFRKDTLVCVLNSFRPCNACCQAWSRTWRAMRTLDHVREIKDSLQSRIPHGTA